MTTYSCSKSEQLLCKLNHRSRGSNCHNYNHKHWLNENAVVDHVILKCRPIEKAYGGKQQCNDPHSKNNFYFSQKVKKLCFERNVMLDFFFRGTSSLHTFVMFFLNKMRLGRDFVGHKCMQNGNQKNQ